MEKPFEQWTPADRERVLTQLQRILESRTFAAASRLQHLLRYLMTEAVSGRGNRLNQASIAIDVLGRDEKFDPAVDSVVRVEAGRLRSKLRDYYQDEGQADDIRIDLPKGAYEPRVRFGGQAAAAPVAAAATPPTAAAHREGMVPRRTARRQALQEFAIGAAVMLAVLAGIWFWRGAPDAVVPSLRTVKPAHDAAKSYDGAKSLAVLPFLNSSAEAEDAGFFADGLHDDLLTQLTKIADIKVISRTSVMGYRGVQKSIPQIANELGVHAVLEGAVQRAGERVRVNVQLIDGRSDTHLWAESYDMECNATNVFEIQRRIATQIATALHATLSPQERQRLAVLPTGNTEAYEAYLKARQRLARRTLEDMRAAVELFRQAVQLDPQFALAYAGIAEAWYLQNNYGGVGEEEMLAEAQPALDRAFALDGQIGEAWTVLGGIRKQQGDDAGAEQAFLRAIELNPNYAQAYHWYSSMLEHERPEKRLELARRARELDPLSPLLRANLAQALENVGRFDDAEAEIRQALELNPEFPVTTVFMGYFQTFIRRDIPGGMPWFVRAMQLDPGSDAEVGLAEAYLVLNEPDRAAHWIERARVAHQDQDLRDLWDARYVYTIGNEALAVERAERMLARTGKYAEKQKEILMWAVRNRDLAEGRAETARRRYAEQFPELAETTPRITRGNMKAAIDLALVLQKLGDDARARQLLDQAAALLPSLQRFGSSGYLLADVEIAALRGDKAGAIAALRRAVDEGWIFYYTDFPDRNPNLALVHGDPEYTALMQRARDRVAEQAARVREMEVAGEIPVPPSA
jgi:TolB-like protein/tetratricopeptide (TPR) repeat protein